MQWESLSSFSFLFFFACCLSLSLLRLIYFAYGRIPKELVKRSTELKSVRGRNANCGQCDVNTLDPSICLRACAPLCVSDGRASERMAEWVSVAVRERILSKGMVKFFGNDLNRVFVSDRRFNMEQVAPKINRIITTEIPKFIARFRLFIVRHQFNRFY